MKILLKYIMFLVLFLVCCISLCFFPIVQKFLAKKILSQYFDNVSISELRIGLSSARVKQCSMRYEDVTLQLGDLQVKWSLKDLFFYKSLTIEHAALADVSISVESEPKDAIYYEKKIERLQSNQEDLGKYIDDVLVKLNSYFAFLKYPISVKTLTINGMIDVYEKTFGEFSIKLANFSRFETANLQFKFASSFSRGFDGSFSVKGFSDIHRNAEGIIDHGKLDASIVSKNYANKTEKEFSVKFGFLKENEEVCLQFTDNKTSQKIIDFLLRKNVDTNARSLVVSAYLNNELLEYFLFGNKSNGWSVAVNGKGENVGDDHNWLFKYNLNADLNKEILAYIFPGLENSVKIRLISAILFKDDHLEITTLTTNVEDLSQKQVKCSCELQSTYKVPYSLKNLVSNLNGICLDVSLDHFDLNILNSIYPSIYLTGVGQGDFRVQIKNNSPVLYSNKEKFRLKNFDVLWQNQGVIRNLNLETNINCTLRDCFNVELSELVCTSDKTEVLPLQGDCKFTFDDSGRNNLAGYLVGDLANILAQPIFENKREITSGLMSINFDIDLTPDMLCSGNLGIKLKSVSFVGDKKSLDVEYDAKMSELNNTKGMKFEMSGNVHCFGETDLELTGEFIKNQDDASKTLQASLKGSSLCISDLLMIGDIFKTKSFDKPKYTFAGKREILEVSEQANELDEISAKLVLNIDKLYWENFCCLSNLSSKVNITGKNINIPDLRCYIFDAPFKGNWNLIHNIADYSTTYSINTAFELSNLNASKIASTFGYDPSAFTGDFNLKGSFESEQNSIKDAILGLRGSMHLNGQDGSIKLNSFLSDKQKGVLGITGIAGSMMGGKTGAISDLINYFSDFKYDTITASLARGSNEIVLDNFTIKNEDMKILSQGKIFYHMGSDIKHSNLFLESQIFTKGELSNLFSEFELVSADVDYYGYCTGPRVTIRGTVSEPDLSEVKSLISKIGSKIIYDDKSLLNPNNLFKMFSK